MSFLYIENGEIKITEEGLSHPIVHEYYKSDKTKKKGSFKVWITYLFYVYKKDGLYKDKLMTDKKRLTCKHHIGKPIDYYKRLDNVLDRFIEVYIASQRIDPIEEFLTKVYKDMDEYINHLLNIKYTITLESIKNVNGEAITEKIEKDNSEEKVKAYKAVTDILKTKEAIEKKVKSTLRETKKKKINRLFDQR